MTNAYTVRGERGNGTIEHANAEGKTVARPSTSAEWDLCHQVDSLIAALKEGRSGR